MIVSMAGSRTGGGRLVGEMAEAALKSLILHGKEGTTGRQVALQATCSATQKMVDVRSTGMGAASDEVANVAMIKSVRRHDATPMPALPTNRAGRLGEVDRNVVELFLHRGRRDVQAQSGGRQRAIALWRLRVPSYQRLWALGARCRRTPEWWSTESARRDRFIELEVALLGVYKRRRSHLACFAKVKASREVRPGDGQPPEARSGDPPEVGRADEDRLNA